MIQQQEQTTAPTKLWRNDATDNYKCSSSKDGVTNQGSKEVYLEE